MKYKYKNLKDNGFVRVKISLNSLYKLGLSKRGSPWVRYVEVYRNDDMYRIYYFHRIWVKILNLLLLPVYYILYGISDYKGINKEIYRLLFQKKCGSFPSDVVFPGDKMYNDLENILKKDKNGKH